MVKRAKAREQAFILIFEKSFSDQEIQEIIEVAKDCLEDYEDNDFTTRLALGTVENISYIDEIIEKNSIGWSTKRISKVSLAILRLCCYEIFYEKDIPTSVSIDQAVELAKKYATEDDASYINGVLGGIVRCDTTETN